MNDKSVLDLWEEVNFQEFVTNFAIDEKRFALTAPFQMVLFHSNVWNNPNQPYPDGALKLVNAGSGKNMKFTSPQDGSYKLSVFEKG